jgi:hypothetical protein
MRRTRLVLILLVALIAAAVLASRLVLTVTPADPDPAPTSQAVAPPVQERRSAKLPELQRLASQAPLSASVTDVFPIYTPIGSVYFVGEITNSGNRPISKPEVIVSLLDENGARLQFESGYPVHDLIEPNEIVPVVVLFSNPPPLWYSFEVFLQAEEATGREFMSYTDLAPTSAELAEDELAGYVLAGAVVNEGELRTEFVQAIVSLYDEHQKIVGVGSAYVEQSKLDPGVSSPFAVRITNVAASAKSYRLQFVGH